MRHTDAELIAAFGPALRGWVKAATCEHLADKFDVDAHPPVGYEGQQARITRHIALEIQARPNSEALWALTGCPAEMRTAILAGAA